jgi:hypothetical protein
MTEDIDNILDYMQRAGLNTINTNSPAWKLLHNVKQTSKIVNTMELEIKKNLIDNTMTLQNGQKLSVGDLVSHVTVPTLGYGLVVAESEKHSDYWIVKWCDPRYYDVGQLGIQAKYLAKIN